MTDNVINFRKEPEPKDLIWVCACGCRSFMLRQDMRAECQHCGAVQEDEAGEWRADLPEPPVEAPPVDRETIRVTVIDNNVLAMKQTLALADVDATAFVAVVQRDGMVWTWGDAVEMDEQRKWVDERLADIRRLLRP